MYSVLVGWNCAKRRDSSGQDSWGMVKKSKPKMGDARGLFIALLLCNVIYPIFGPWRCRGADFIRARELTGLEWIFGEFPSFHWLFGFSFLFFWALQRSSSNCEMPGAGDTPLTLTSCFRLRAWIANGRELLPAAPVTWRSRWNGTLELFRSTCNVC